MGLLYFVSYIFNHNPFVKQAFTVIFVTIKNHANKIFKKFRRNKTDGHGSTCEPIDLSGIANLEATFNNGNPFPTALKELLFLAGDYCPYLDFEGAMSQKELQDEVRNDLNFFSLTISPSIYGSNVLYCRRRLFPYGLFR